MLGRLSGDGKRVRYWRYGVKRELRGIQGSDEGVITFLRSCLIKYIMYFIIRLC